MKKLIDIRSYPAADVLDTLLQDKSTKKNIIWATDTYEELGGGFTDKAQISKASLMLRSDIIRPRIQKSLEAQAQRTRKKAEVFTPAWLCNRMNNHLDEDWFGRTGVFNTENEDHTWTVTEEKIEIPEGKTWQQYVDSRRLEITCGEAPYLVSRYDVSTGELIVPPKRRIGMLDRKLRLVNENTDSFDDWLKWVIRAFEACYGYEYQGDNVLIARINLLLTFVDYYEERWQKKPDPKFVKQITNIIAWNIWQMDGLKDTVPLGKPYEEYQQLSLFDMPASMDESTDKPEIVPCRIFNWRSRSSLKFMDVKELRNMGKKLFDYVIGNPPYQEDKKDVGRQAKPIYNLFMDEVQKLEPDSISLITPSRWFAGGIGLDDYRNRMMSEHHIKAMIDYPNAKEVFPNTSISGGVNYFIWKKQYNGKCEFTSILNGNTDSMTRNLDEFSVLVRYNKAVKIIRKVQALGEPTMNSIISSISPYALATSVRGTKEKDTNHTLRMYSSKGVSYISDDAVSKGIDTINTYRAMISQTSAEHAGEPSKDGKFRVLTTSMKIMEPGDVCTHSYIFAGPLKSKIEAENVLLYLQTKFARFLLLQAVTSIHISRSTFVFVPLLDFSKEWSDKLLAEKYGITNEEIDYINSFIKEF